MATAPKMRALIFHGPKQVSLEQIERFAPGPDEVVVRVRACAVCTTERRIYGGQLNLPFPIIAGHEVSGVIEPAGASDADLKPGDPVVIDTMERCGACRYCLRGESHLCSHPKVSRGGYLIIGGGFAEQVVLPRKSVFKVSPQLSFEEACLAEPVACCLHSLNKAAPSPGETVVILGAGTMGAIHLLLAKLKGVNTIVCDPDEGRLQLAGRLGAGVLINPAHEDPAALVRRHTAGEGADVVIVAAGSAAAGRQALAMTARRGRVVLFASTHPSAPLELDWNSTHYREIMITGTESKTPADLYQAAQLLSCRTIDVRPLISRLISLEELPEELGNTPSGETQRVVVRFG